MLAVSLVFGSFLTILFLVVGLIGGWTAREYMMNYREVPRPHPEMFDNQGNLIPDEVIAFNFENYYDDSEENDDELRNLLLLGKKVAPPAPIPDLPNNPFIYEILDVVSQQRTKAKKVEALKKFEAPVLKTIFIRNFDESVISVLPEGDVPYAAIDGETGFNGTLSEKIEDATRKMEELGSILYRCTMIKVDNYSCRITKFYNFIKGGNDSMNGILRRETMFINILQGCIP